MAWIDHPDADVKPVHARVWADSQLVYEGDLRRTPLFLDIPGDAGQDAHGARDVDRSDCGARAIRAAATTRELGLSIRDWVWE